MTCLEKLKQDHPDWCEDAIRDRIETECPDTFGYLESPSGCYICGGDILCEECWNREIPEETCEPPVSDKQYNLIQKAYDLMVGFCHEGKTTNLEEVIGYLGEALDDHSEDSIEAKFAIATPIEDNGCEPHIKDSGNRTQFESGAVRDMREGKGRCDLMPLEVAAKVFSDPVLVPKGYDINLCDIRKFQETNNTCYLYYVLRRFAIDEYDDFETMLLEVAKHFEDGAKKYGESNWQKGIPAKCYIDSAVRHYLKWRRGDKDEPHDRAFVWNLMCCIWEVDYHKKEDEE